MDKMLEPVERLLQEALRQLADAMARAAVDLISEMLEEALTLLKEAAASLMQGRTASPAVEQESALH